MPHSEELAHAVIEARVHDRPGVLARIAGMFYRRGINLTALRVTPVGDGAFSRMIIDTGGPRRELERLVLAMDNLVDVVDVRLA